MNQENLVQLNRIFNTLLLVSTKGEDTMIMGDCLKAFKQLLAEISSKKPEQEEE